MRLSTRTTLASALSVTALFNLVPAGAGAAAKPSPRRPAPSAEACALLDNPKLAGRMDGLLLSLAVGCGREAEFLGNVKQEGGGEAPDFAPTAADVAVSDPTQDPSGTAKTQSETTIALNPVTGTLCSAWNDSYSGVTLSIGFSGFGRSTDNGATWVDKGAVNPTTHFDYGDPSLIWRKLDGKFYYAALTNPDGLSVYRSDDDCNSFTFVAAIASGSDDKEIMTVDNNVASPYYGRLYVVWTDFGAGNRIYSTYSSDAGATWSAQVALSTSTSVQGAWPVVAANGDVFAAWVAWLGAGFPDGNLEIQVARSTNGGVGYSLLTPPMTNQTGPRDPAASSSCGRPALKGNIRYLPSPTIAIDAAGVLHAVYSYDPDATASGDTVNVYYRRSLDNGTSWQPEVLINDDGTTTDQYQPSLSVGEGNVVAIGYYSRQNDVAANLLLDYYSRVSYNGGATWQPSTRLSDVSTPVVLDPNLATCYHGDYDTQIHRPGAAQYLWSDDRNPGATGADPNIYTESTPAGVDFLAVSPAGSQSICVPSNAVYPIDVVQFQGFVEPVTLGLSGNPSPSSSGFSVNPVVPPGTSTLTLSNLATVASGSYSMTLTGTSSPSAIVHTSPLELIVYAAAPGSTTLTSPANLATQVVTKPTFAWTAVANATGYTLELDDDAGFSSPFYTVSVSGTTHTLPAALPRGAEVFWRVSAVNPCGPGVASGIFSFTVSDAICWQPNLAIPDDPDVSDTRTVTGFGGNITDLDLTFRATHTYVSDMIFRLVHVDTATTVTVIDRPGTCSGDNFDVTLNDEGTDGTAESACNATPPAVSGNRTPNNPLSAFDTQSFNGSWRLECSDQAGFDVGVLQEWCLGPTGVTSALIFSDDFEFASTGRWSSSAQ